MVTEQHSPGPWGGMASCLLQAQLEPLCPRCPRGQAVQAGSSCWDRAREPLTASPAAGSGAQRAAGGAAPLLCRPRARP